MTLSVSPAEFMARTPAPTGGNSPWASGYGYDLRDVIVRQAHRQPRSVQRHLGPSELGSPCPRQIVSKLCGPGVASYTNHVADPWPSVVGTAVHAQLAQFFENENQLNGTKRWYTETRVHPHPLYPGTSDVYDAVEKCVTDWKIQGPTSMAKIRSREGPSRQYKAQVLLYAWGWRNAGFEVRRVAIASMPRTGRSLSGMYVWEKVITPEDDLFVAGILHEVEALRYVAQLVLSGRMPIAQVRRVPGDECVWCPFYRPESARDGDYEHGCPGHSAPA